jgi:hypothetical protein
VANFRVTGPYFFEDKDGRAVTVTSTHYVEMLQKFLNTRTELSTIWFQQDGATAHTARASMEVSLEMFPQHVISLRGELPWPACSLDFPACDYFL